MDHILIKILFLLGSLVLVIRWAMIATKYAGKLAENFQRSKYIVGLIVVAIISLLPETFVSLWAIIEGIPEFGLATLFGSNIADLTLIFAIVILLSWRKNITIERSILKNNKMYPFFFLIPLMLWIDGFYDRIEGVILILLGGLFYYFAFKNWWKEKQIHIPREKNNYIKNSLFLLIGLGMLLLWAHFTVITASEFAYALGVAPLVIGILVVWLGTTLPELFFAYNAVKKHNDGLAIGDILWTVLADATIVVWIIATISPFIFPKNIIYVTWIFMLIATIVLVYFMRTEKTLSKKEGFLLLLLWLLAVIVELLINK